MYKNILLASDGSAHAERAAQQAVRLAALYQGKVTVLFVAGSSKSKEDLTEVGKEVRLTKERLKGTEEFLMASKISYELEFISGEPGPSIVNFVNDNAFDILVIGSRGLNGLQEMILGSVSHKVVKRTKCPVLIVK
ncbi:universal stress protein [Planococcus sp. ISL-110]|uniref:universal stress protein n=1 Tax=Planococcus sp. ISL-110 TaxID=2819167 RepID=UPI001BE583BC|nr:universal stress protein [Planococcus sp. ISL-110]